MNKLVQLLLYTIFAVVVVYFSIAPGYRYADPGLAEIKLSLSHAADRVEECVKLTPQQINERALAGEPLNECARERLPLTVRLEIDGELLKQIEAPPSGLWADGPASVYERFAVPPGQHRVAVRLRDSARDGGWDYALEDDVDLTAGRYLTITFKAETGGFRFR